MFVMASMLQKAIRRGDKEKAGYAAYEMFGTYDAMLWKRLYVVSAEDCWGVLTKEIDFLHQKHIEANEGLKGYDKKTGYVSVTVSLLCDALKSRDACYYACNFILSDNEGNGITPCTAQDVNDYALRNACGPTFFDAASAADECMTQAYKLYQSIQMCNMEDSGYAIKILSAKKPDMIWEAVRRANDDFANGEFADEIEALYNADQYVNKKFPPEKRDPIFLSKSVMILMYALCGKYRSVTATPLIQLRDNVDYIKYPYVDIRKCLLPDRKIPDYVFDVHTIQGKRAGHTDWEMNLVENDALNPFQKAFFDEGSWELRYDYKHRTGICTEGEYLESLEYRKTHEANPAKTLLKFKEVRRT